MSLHCSNIQSMSTLQRVIPRLSLLLIFSLFSSPSLAANTLLKGNSLQINGSLISSGGIFKLGFFRTNPNGGYYLGISYNNIPVNTIIWVANREAPVDERGSLLIGFNGSLNLLSGEGNILWSSNSTLEYSNCSAKIEDTGNLVLSSDRAILWESFEHPTDTLLPGVDLTSNLLTGETSKLVSWKTPEDPSPGKFFLSLDPKGSDQIFIYNGSEIWWRSGKWNKKSFIGITRMKALSFYGFTLDLRDNRKLVLSFSYFSPFVRFVMQWNGIENTSVWTPQNRSWTEVWLQPLTDCERYDFCGNYSVCDEGLSPKCRCLQGFNPTSEGSCVRRNSLQCDGGFGYARMEKVKVPDFAEWISNSSDESSCRSFCSMNCSCKAFSYVEDVGCLIWTVDLVDLAQLPADGSTMFLKLDIRDLDSGRGGNIKKVLSITLPIVLVVILLMCIFCGWKYKAMIKGKKMKSEVAAGSSETQSGVSGDKHLPSFRGSLGQREDSVDLPLYSFDAIAAATDNFSEERKLGQGGFGVVYKGVLPGGEEIAVKRLSRNSCQGLDEFKNEVMVIAHLQHRNLVRLLGCCFQEEEKMLVYEYMQNKSLDSLLFDPERKLLLDWRKRFSIIEGVARGLLYLHRDSRLKIVHRDLKASNILLDEDMNPKISDFGMARIFGGNQNQDNTTRVVGTFGYMSPEYAMEGLFSEKSDVYSFGVLVLEIVSGRKNARTRSENYSSLLGYAWQLWVEQRPEDLIDTGIRESCDVRQAIRCIHIGLLCVQNLIKDRLTMSTVVILLSSQNPIEGSPQQPTFLLDSNLNDTAIRNINEDRFSSNEVTITELTGR